MSPVHRGTYPRSSCRLADTKRCAGAPAGRLSARSFGPLLRRRSAISVALAGLMISGCAAAEAPGDSSGEVVAFPRSAVTPDHLGSEVLGALVAGDVPSLESFRLTEREHNDVVWPELPASAPEVNFPLDYAWTNIENRNRRALGRILDIYRGEDLRFGRVECRGATQRFESFEVLTDCWVIFARLGDPEAYEAQIFKDVLLRAGGHKIFRYYDEEPRRYGSG